jgi:anaerobic selenocysteine-containing dehydrogenase
VVEPASPHLRSEVAIVGRMAQATLNARSSVDWQGLIGNYDRIREHIEHVVPGFTQYNRRVREPGGFYLPNAPREGRFTTKSGRAHFTIQPLPGHALTDGQLLLTTVRSHDQFNTTIYGENDRYRGVYGGRRVIFVNEEDIRQRGLEAGQMVDLISHHGHEQRRADRFKLVPYSIPRGCAAAYFPETNVLVPVQSVADGSNQPASKSIVITLQPSAASHEAFPRPG